jgi:8-oxo-dGTP pyrophosphatase MutT (NUDIX family)
MSEWQVLESEIVLSTPWLRVRRDDVLNHNGKALTYHVVESAHPSVFIVALNRQGKVLLQHAYRYTLDRDVWQIPGGFSDGQTPLIAAKREFEEETGYQSDDWKELGTIYQSVGIANMPGHVFLAQNIRKNPHAEMDADEHIKKLHFVSFDGVDATVQSGRFSNTAAVAAIYMAKLELQKTPN